MLRRIARTSVVWACAVLALAGADAEAQDLQLHLRNGLVTLKARDVSIAEVLRRWADVGSVSIVQRGRPFDARVTLDLTDVPERTAVDILLRGTSGYLLIARSDATSGLSTIERLLVLGSSSPLVAGTTSSPMLPPSANQPGMATGFVVDVPERVERPAPAPVARPAAPAAAAPGIRAPSPSPFGVTGVASRPGEIVPVPEGTVPPPAGGLSTSEQILRQRAQEQNPAGVPR